MPSTSVRLRPSIAWLVALTLSGAAAAQHCLPSFDLQREVTLVGAVREFRWANPHCVVQVLVTTKTGTETWSVEMSSPRQLLQAGWKPGTLRVGDRIRLRIHPLRDGSHGGDYILATAADGTAIAPSIGTGQMAQFERP